MRNELAINPTPWNILAFATPMILNSLIQFSFTFVDSLMVAPLGDAALGGVGQGGILYNVILTFFLGIIGMYTPLAARAMTQEDQESGNVRSSLYMVASIAVVCTLVVWVILQFAGNFLTFMKQPVETTDVSVRYLGVQQWAVLSIFLYSCLVQTAYLYERPRLGMYTVIAGNAVNVLFNWLFLSGYFGSANAGVEGVAWATVIARSLMVVMLFVLLNRQLEPQDKLTSWRLVRFDPSFYRNILSRGVPRGLNNLNDWFASFVMVLMVGWGGMQVAAANQVTDVLTSLMYMIPQAFCSVITLIASKQIGMDLALGKRKQTIMRLMKIALAFAVGIVAVTWLALNWILHSFALEPGSSSHTLASNMMVVHFLFFAAYTVQFSMLAVLDSYLDTKVPSLLAILSSYCLVLPLAFLAYKFGYGAVGIWIADGVGLTVLASIYTYRVVGLLREPKRGISQAMEVSE